MRQIIALNKTPGYHQQKMIRILKSKHYLRRSNLPTSKELLGTDSQKRQENTHWGHILSGYKLKNRFFLSIHSSIEQNSENIFEKEVKKTISPTPPATSPNNFFFQISSSCTSALRVTIHWYCTNLGRRLPKLNLVPLTNTKQKPWGNQDFIWYMMYLNC